MGTWGHGNLDNDSAWDELFDRSAELVKAIMERAKSKTSREFDEYDYTTLFVEFEILFALESKGLFSGHTLPGANEVEALKTDFISDWVEYIGDQASDDHLKKRRQCIMRTFNRFQKLCVKYETEDQ